MLHVSVEMRLYSELSHWRNRVPRRNGHRVVHPCTVPTWLCVRYHYTSVPLGSIDSRGISKPPLRCRCCLAGVSWKPRLWPKRLEEEHVVYLNPQVEGAGRGSAVGTWMYLLLLCSDWFCGKQGMTVTKDLVASSDCLYFTKWIHLTLWSFCLIGKNNPFHLPVVLSF